MTIEEGCQKDWKDVTDDPIANTDEGWIDRDDFTVIPKEAVGKFIDARFVNGTELSCLHSENFNWGISDCSVAVNKWRLTRSPLSSEEVKAQDVHSLNRSVIRPVEDGESYQKQERYLDESGGDWIDEFAATKTPEQFRAAMEFTIGKYERRLGKKDVMSSELYKISDYYRRWSEYEKGLEG